MCDARNQPSIVCAQLVSERFEQGEKDLLFRYSSTNSIAQEQRPVSSSTWRVCSTDHPSRELPRTHHLNAVMPASKTVDSSGA